MSCRRPDGSHWLGWDAGRGLELCRAPLLAGRDYRNYAPVQDGIAASGRRRRRWDGEKLDATSGDATEEEVAGALTEAWADLVGDTGCYPDCFTWRGGNGKLSADFTRGNFARMVASALAARRPRRAEVVEAVRP